MKRLAWIAASACTAIAVVASCVPDFQFAEHVEPTPDAGLDGPVVPCGDKDASADCSPGETCCYHSSDGDCDKCAGVGMCVGEGDCADSGAYAVLSCNTKEDCLPGQYCCATVVGVNLIKSITCQPGCDATQFLVCTSDQECTAPKVCDEVYAGYKICREPPP